MQGPARISASCSFAAMAIRFGRSNKYKAVAIDTPDGRFHSTAEYQRWCELKLLVKARQISELQRQVRYLFTVAGRPVLIPSPAFPKGRQVRFTVDFTYFERGNPTLICEEYKGFDTPESRLRRAVFVALYPEVELRITHNGRKTARLINP